uniref:Uncharacterized protein n=1 Tax=Rhizophora mucronata TaxID=61149 RepID=A0A2P2N623_RHIMU
MATCIQEPYKCNLIRLHSCPCHIFKHRYSFMTLSMCSICHNHRRPSLCISDTHALKDCYGIIQAPTLSIHINKCCINLHMVIKSFLLNILMYPLS